MASEPSVISDPVFVKCVRCGYSLRGLPARHACPECGLQYDEGCKLFRPDDPRKTLLIWLAIFGGGWMNLKNLPHIFHYSTASLGQKVLSLLAIVWVIIIAYATWVIVARYRRGFLVAITADGLLVRLPGFQDDVYPWSDISGAERKDIPDGKPQIAFVSLQNGKRLTIGGMSNVFPDRSRVTDFVDEVNRRVGG